jgi:3-polyprenyl-4-hydroxybenzoate decarboxylase
MNPIAILAALAALPKTVYEMGVSGLSERIRQQPRSKNKWPNPKPRQRHAVKNHKRKHHRQKGRK